MAQIEWTIGEEVAIRVGDAHVRARIMRLTPSGRIVVDRGNFSEQFYPDGRAVKQRDAWHRNHLIKLTPEIRNQMEWRESIRILESVKWREQSLDTLRAVRAALEAAAKEQDKDG